MTTDPLNNISWRASGGPRRPTTAQSDPNDDLAATDGDPRPPPQLQMRPPERREAGQDRPRCAEATPKGAKATPGGAKETPKGAQRRPGGAKATPRDAHGDAKGSSEAPPGDEKSTAGAPVQKNSIKRRPQRGPKAPEKKTWPNLP